MNRCENCKQTAKQGLLLTSIVLFQSKIWHKSCFKCSKCNASLDPIKSASLVNNILFCKNCARSIPSTVIVKKRDETLKPSKQPPSDLITLEVLDQPIAEQQVDVVVTSVGSHLNLKRGVLSKALLEKAGAELQDELFQRRDECSDVYVTQGYKLPCEHVIHVVCTRYENNPLVLQKFGDTVKNILIEADKLEAQSIALPAIGTGKLAYPPSLVANIMVKGILDHVDNNLSSKLKQFRFTILAKDKATFDAFQDAVRKRERTVNIPGDAKVNSQLPLDWSINTSKESFKRHKLTPDKLEFKNIVENVRRTDGAKFVKQVQKIERIENQDLFEMFESSKNLVKRNSPQCTTVERTLWHGTTSGALDNICRFGFNRAYCGKNGVLYGKGVYCAKNFSYSADDRYSISDEKGFKYIIQCRVLTGEFAAGNRDMLEPPEKPSKDRYDSTVDDPDNPTIFVIFADYRIYPEYVISIKS